MLRYIVILLILQISASSAVLGRSINKKENIEAAALSLFLFLLSIDIVLVPRPST